VTLLATIIAGWPDWLGFLLAVLIVLAVVYLIRKL
jgi:hypothetical protein